ncbi:hypothetical protein [Sandarakinorhabdus sp.]|uniref:hypothetical protein n=1 Tax=Sandarakinorhabdus sp. TaxID=1916663 RepID=UPI003F6E6386
MHLFTIARGSLLAGCTMLAAQTALAEQATTVGREDALTDTIIVTARRQDRIASDAVAAPRQIALPADAAAIAARVAGGDMFGNGALSGQLSYRGVAALPAIGTGSRPCPPSVQAPVMPRLRSRIQRTNILTPARPHPAILETRVRSFDRMDEFDRNPPCFHWQFQFPAFAPRQTGEQQHDDRPCPCRTGLHPPCKPGPLARWPCMEWGWKRPNNT